MCDKSDKMRDKPVKKLYRDTLDKLTRDRYNQKIAVIGVDPYELNKSMLTDDYKCLPAVTYIDIINYLVCTTSTYTMDELKAYKSLESFNQFVNGWVKDVKSMSTNNKVLVTGRVRHSQCMNDTPLKPWIISSSDGIVECAHCDCMAGLGEVCTHVGALLFFIEQAHKITVQTTVTGEKAYWLLPSSIDKVSYAEIREIDFTSTDTKKRQLDCASNGESARKRMSLKLPEVLPPTVDEIQQFNQALFSTGTKPSVLSVIDNYQDSYVPDILKEGQLPICLSKFKNEKYALMDRKQLLDECGKLYDNISITETQAQNTEFITRTQRHSKEWRALRMGRVTASNMKSACVTSLLTPSITTVKRVCGTSRFTNKATQWGCKHKEAALSAYTNKVKLKHVNVIVDKCGMFINPKYPHIGASPDATVKYDCCGEGVVEVKCPYCVKDEVLVNTGNRVEFLENGYLKTNHKYSYQVQRQLLVTERSYCDFVVWTQKDCSVERIEPDGSIHETIKTKSRDFFLQVVLPEITGNLITREKQPS